MKTYWIYILYCNNHSYYTGYTTDLTKRYQAHLDGSSQCKYTRSFKPIKIAQSWQIYGTQSVAMQIERFIKKLSRADKENLISKPQYLEQIYRVSLPCCYIRE